MYQTLFQSSRVAMVLTLTVIETNNGTLHELDVKPAHFSPEYKYRNY